MSRTLKEAGTVVVGTGIVMVAFAVLFAHDHADMVQARPSEKIGGIIESLKSESIDREQAGKTEDGSKIRQAIRTLEGTLPSRAKPGTKFVLLRPRKRTNEITLAAPTEEQLTVANAGLKSPAAPNKEEQADEAHNGRLIFRVGNGIAGENRPSRDVKLASADPLAEKSPSPEKSADGTTSAKSVNDGEEATRRRAANEDVSEEIRFDDESRFEVKLGEVLPLPEMSLSLPHRMGGGDPKQRVVLDKIIEHLNREAQVLERAGLNAEGAPRRKGIQILSAIADGCPEGRVSILLEDGTLRFWNEADEPLQVRLFQGEMLRTRLALLRLNGMQITTSGAKDFAAIDRERQVLAKERESNGQLHKDWSDRLNAEATQLEKAGSPQAAQKVKGYFKLLDDAQYIKSAAEGEAAYFKLIVDVQTEGAELEKKGKKEEAQKWLRAAESLKGALRRDVARTKKILSSPAESARNDLENVQADKAIAEMVERFNILMDERLFGAALTLAEQARQLQPRNRVGETMYYKAKRAVDDSRIQQNRRKAVESPANSEEEAANSNEQDEIELKGVVRFDVKLNEETQLPEAHFELPVRAGITDFGRKYALDGIIESKEPMPEYEAKSRELLRQEYVLKRAVVSLKNAGLEDQAREVSAVAEKTQKEFFLRQWNYQMQVARMRESARPSTTASPASPPPIDHHRTLTELREQVQELRKEVGQVRALLEQKP